MMGRTTLVITHRVHSILSTDEIIELKNGSLVNIYRDVSSPELKS